MRNRTIFGAPGLAYVYLSYGVHHLINVVCENEGVGSAVLIRALRPLEGRELMAERRGRNTNLCNGPGRLTQALGIDLSKDGHDLTEGSLSINCESTPDGQIISTTRIGITRGTDLPWRYLILGESNVSKPPVGVAERGLKRSF